MVPRPWRGFTRSVWDALTGRSLPHDAPAPAAPAAWERGAARRRWCFLGAVVLLTALATTMLAHALPMGHLPWLRTLQLGLFTILFAWVCAGFVTALMGFLVHLRGGDPLALSRHDVAHRPLPADARTALIMPICNEHVPTVFAGLRATCESVAAAGGGGHFDLFILSDTSDPAIREAELAAWARLKQELAGVAPGLQVHYRWRKRRTHRKAGNVADFCRRWGKLYRYMVVLDADSVMSGDCLVTLVKLMEAHPGAGIIQTAPQAVGQSTLHARAQQFSSKVMGRLFTLGMQFWQLGESHYWGHNAIIRIEPFMKHCALAPVPGRGALSGSILSHDFVEAALMRRAGYHVWLVTDLGGSFEQTPPNLVEELRRDRRWCQGNLQNARLIAEPGLHPVHRAMLATGAMAYVSAPLWLAFLGLGAAAWIDGQAPAAAPSGPSWALLAVWIATVAMLLLPRVLAVASVLADASLRRRFGGTAALLASAAAETALSVLQAPVRMVAHTVFVVAALTGWRIGWQSPPRDAMALPWRDALRRFGAEAALALLALGLVATWQPQALPWLLPVTLPLLMAAPVAVFTSREPLGQRMRQRGMLLIPEEAAAPAVIRRTRLYLAGGLAGR